MISGVSSYSSYAYSSASSTQRSAPPSGGCAGGPAKMQEKLFSLLDSDGSGSVAKDELESALTAAKETDSSLTIDIDDLFSQLDANSDGSLSSDETAALAPPPPSQGGFNSEEMFSQLDANGDGSIDTDELSALPTPPGSDSSALLSELDSDGDGALNVDELSAMAPPPPPPPAQDGASSDELFSQLDADSSGSISQDELSSLLDAVGQQSKASSSEEENYSGLIAKLLKQYQDSASYSYSSSIGSQLSVSA